MYYAVVLNVTITVFGLFNKLKREYFCLMLIGDNVIKSVFNRGS